MLTLAKKTAVVTGASRSIGEAIALKLGEYGAGIAVIYNNSEAAAVNVAEKIRKSGVKAYHYKCDVSNYTEAETTVKRILDDFGNIDILVNNAGIVKDKLLLTMKETDYDEVLDVNLKGTFNMIRHTVRPFIKNNGGKIINITSVIGLMGNAGQVNYAASKSGIIGLTKSVAKELAGKNITCNAVAPGYIETSMTEIISDEAKKNLFAMIPLRRAGKPEDVADLVLFLASDHADYITGEIIKVDGGLYI